MNKERESDSEEWEIDDVLDHAYFNNPTHPEDGEEEEIDRPVRDSPFRRLSEL